MLGGTVSDIVERLRAWVYTDSQYATAREAADEIERLRSRPCPYVTGRTTQYCTLTPLALTDAERESLRYYIGTGGPYVVDVTLAGLLSRTGSDDEKTADDAAECHSQSQKTPERERITDAEREAVENCIYASERIGDDWSDKQAATLRGLLERL